MFRYLLVAVIGYWIVKRIFKINDAIRKPDPNTTPNQNTKKDDKHGGDYVEYEEVE